MPRDLIGYAGDPPDPKWPGDANLALNFVINYEEGSEYNIADGDGFSEASLTEMPASSVPHGERDVAAESMFEFGSRVGFWRLRSLFDQCGLPATIFACALALERNPPAVAAIRQSGFDICSHGWRWVEHYKLDEETERAHIARAVASLQELFGHHPPGWYCRTGPSVNTRRLLVEEGGFSYDSDAYNDELPYWLTVAGQPHLVVPYSLTCNDSKFGRGIFASGADFFDFLKEAFDLLLSEGRAGKAKMMSVGLHMRLAGHPARASGLARFLDYAAGHDDVWICHRRAIADHWRALYPYDPETAAEWTLE
jgi:peptidoglycan/xylan/chitin deacetylase (PgdA/CDA1 family)